MRSVASSLIIGGLIIIGGFEAKADENYFMNHTCSTYGGNCTYEILKSTGSGNNYSINKVTTWTRNENSNKRLMTNQGHNTNTYWHDVNENKLYFTLHNENGTDIEDNNEIVVYDISTDTWSTETLNTDTLDTDPMLNAIPVSRSSEISTNASNISSNDTDISNNASNISSNDTDIATNASNISSNDTDIATNASNITTNKNNINTLGEGVANATALTAALTALPQVSIDSKLSCGIGTGTYSSSYALGVGCASKVNERLNVNFGGYYVGGGSKDYGSGTLDTVAAKAGFVFKLGKITKPTLISMKEKKELKTEVKNLKSTNQELKNLLALQNQRLEKLEQIALGNFNSKELVSSLQ